MLLLFTGVYKIMYRQGVLHMANTVLYTSEYIRIFCNEEGYFIESFRKGMSFDQLNRIIAEHPEIRITSFGAIREAVINAPSSPFKFGEAKERVEVEISSDELKAYVTLSVGEDELENRNGAIGREILAALERHKVTFGVKMDILNRPFRKGEKILAAEGIPPQNGEDAVVRMFEIREAKPRLTSSGDADFYELDLINSVKAGDWLGERRDPTPGIPGMSVTGRPIKAVPGKKQPLAYDRNTVKEVYDNGLTTLYALRDGAVFYKDGRISVSNHIEVAGNVDFKIGNIDFDGFVTVMGGVEDNFSVCASKDIEIRGEYGIGGVKEITSREGSVYIAGGVAGKGKAVIKARHDIYVKFVSDTTVICDGTVHVGYYALNSDIKAKQVILESPKSHIIGGTIEAEIKVTTSTVGSESEKRTQIRVNGFDRNKLKEELEQTIYKLEEQRNELFKIKAEMGKYSSDKLSEQEYNEFEITKSAYDAIRQSIMDFEMRKKALAGYIRALGEGEVSILLRAYPNTFIMIKGICKEITKLITGTTFYYLEGEMREK